MLNMNRNKKVLTRTGTALLCAAVVANTCMLPVMADSAQPEKDENVYVNLNSDGSVSGIYVVNEFDMEEDADITDHGDYTTVKNLTSDEEITVSGDEVKVHAGKGKFYYQGDLETKKIPWDISIRYELDGKELSAEDLAGKSGDLKITVSVKDNVDSDDDFYDNYLVQGTVTLDTTKCSGIKADGATQANVGSDRQLLYNIMAGEEKEFTITATVEDFEMDAISFQAVPMGFDIDTDSMDKDELYDQTDELKDAADEFDDGAGKLKDGVSELQDGVSELQSGAGSMQSGAYSLKSGTGQLSSGAQTVQSGAAELASGGSKLSEGASSVSEGSSAVSLGMKELNKNMKVMESGAGELHDALTALSDQSETLKSGSASVLAALEQMQSSLADGMSMVSQSSENLESLKSQNSSSADYLRGIASQATAIYGSLDGATQAMAQTLSGGVDVGGIAGNLNNIAGLLEMNNSTYDALEAATTELISGQMSELKTAVDTLTEEYKNLNAGIIQYTDGTTEVQKAYSEFYSAYGQVVKAADSLSEGAKAVAEGSSSVAENSSKLAEGAKELKSGTSTLAGGISTVDAGAGSLADGANELYSGTGELASGVSELADGTNDLKEGTEEFKDKTKDMDSDIDDKINDMVSEISGEDYVPVSFTSSRNKEIGLVQFAMKTESISVEDEEDVVEMEPTEKSFGQKLKDLF